MGIAEKLALTRKMKYQTGCYGTIDTPHVKQCNHSNAAPCRYAAVSL